jgi:hypothetical protein
MSIVELVDYKIVLVCIYRSPDGLSNISIKFGNNNSKSAIKKEKSNFMWRLEILQDHVN